MGCGNARFQTQFQSGILVSRFNERFKFVCSCFYVCLKKRILGNYAYGIDAYTRNSHFDKTCRTEKRVAAVFIHGGVKQLFVCRFDLDCVKQLTSQNLFLNMRFKSFKG